MKTKFTTFLMVLSFVIVPVFSQEIITLTGTLPDTDTLRSENTYYVSGTLNVNHGDSLVVLPGTVVQFRAGAKMIIKGKLFGFDATFTADLDHAVKGYWNYIQIGDNYNVGHIFLEDCNLSYGGKDQNGMLYAYNGTTNLVNTIVSLSYYSGVVLLNRGELNITDSEINGCNWPIEYRGTGQINDQGGNNYLGNNHNGVYINFRSQNAAWKLPQMVLNDEVGVDKEMMPFVFVSYFYIRNGHTLKVMPGIILKSNNWIYVEGKLDAQGTELENIFFTSDRNDNLGGDTNANGAGNVPTPGVWGGVWFKASSDNSSQMKYCDISFGGSGSHGGVVVERSNPTIDHCSFSNNYYGAEFRAVAKPTFSNNIMASSKVVPVAMSFDSDPVFTDNEFSSSDNEYDAIGLLDGKLDANSTLKQRDFTDIKNVTFLMLGNLTIPEDYTLTINKGIVIKTRGRYRIIVKGGLKANGFEEGTPVVFTSSKDDFHGNPVDTNKDGSQTDPNENDWYGIMFETTINEGNCILNHAWVKYASHSSYYGGQYLTGGAITMENCSPTITNCVIQDAKHGIYIFQKSNPVIKNNKIFNTSYTPIAISVMAKPEFEGNQFINTSWTGLGLIDQNVGLDGAIPIRNIAGYQNITYVLMNDMTINSGSVVNVDPGIIIKFNSGRSIIVDGGFHANGTISEEFKDSITFTSINDDNYGNPADTRNDGDAKAPSSGDWRRIFFRATADDVTNHLSYCNFLFGGSNEGTLVFNDAGNEVSHSIISDSRTYGLRFEGSSTAVCTTDVQIKNCVKDPIAMSLKSNPLFDSTSPLFKSMGNGSNGIKIIEGTLSDDAELITRNVGEIPNVAYIIDRLTIKPNATLTIRPGVVIKFTAYSYYGITVEGALNATGTAKSLITFTSIHDDNKGGDTNDNGNATTPNKGNWWDIRFTATSLSENNKLAFCEIFYGGSGYSNSNYTQYGAIRIFNTTVDIHDTRIEHSNTSAVGVYGSATPVIQNNEINNIRYTPITMSLFSSPTFSGNTCDNIGIFCLGLATENYSTNAIIPMRNFAGHKNIPYYIYNTCNINSGTTLTIADSLVFKSRNRTMFKISGGLKIFGTFEKPVVFTHEYDDEHGNPGDTNEDGLIKVPTNNSGTALTFEDIADDDSCQLFGAIFRHMQYGIILNQASPVIDSCKFEHTQWGIRLNGVSQPLVRKNDFTDLTYTPLVNSLVSYPRAVGENNIYGTTWGAMGVISEELVQDVTLEKKNFAGIENIPYFFSGNYTIGTSVTLTINPGVVCKFNKRSRLYVDRGLWAVGGIEPNEKIVFTDYRDDFYGGDINSDSTATYPAADRWDGITFRDEALDPLCKLEHCIIRNVGNSGTDAAITTAAASPTILNSSITKSINGLRATLASNPVINNCDLYEITNFGVENVNKAFLIDAENNWWGHTSGPSHVDNPGGMGTKVSDKVDYLPYQQLLLNPIMGDVSLNGMIQAYDASLVLQAVVESLILTEAQERVGDVDDNGTIQAFDATLIQQFVVGAIEVFPAEKSSKMVDAAQFEVGSPVLNNDQTFYLPIYLRNDGNILAVSISAGYNAGNLELMDVLQGIDADHMLMAHNKSFEGVRIAMAGTSELSTDAELLRLHFRNIHPNEAFTTGLTFEKLIANTDDVTPFALSPEFFIEASVTDLSHPSLARLEVYPNPSYGHIYISYTLKKESDVTLELYNLSGQQVAVLFDDIQASGEHLYHFTKNIDSGIYFVRFTSENRVKYRKITVR